MRFVSVHMVHKYTSFATTAPEKKLCFILSDRLNFYMINNLLIIIHAFTRRILMSLSDDTLLSRYIHWSTNFRELPFRVEMSFFFNQNKCTLFYLHSHGG